MSKQISTYAQSLKDTPRQAFSIRHNFYYKSNSTSNYAVAHPKTTARKYSDHINAPLGIKTPEGRQREARCRSARSHFFTVSRTTEQAMYKWLVETVRDWHKIVLEKRVHKVELQNLCWVHAQNCLQYTKLSQKHRLAAMGVGRIFSRVGVNSDFSRYSQKDFSKGDESGEISFYQFETKKTTIFCLINLIEKCQISKSRGTNHPCPLPTPVLAASAY